MKVIMPVHKGYLAAHFGRAEQFVMYDIENGEVKEKHDLAAAYDTRHGHLGQGGYGNNLNGGHQCSHNYNNNNHGESCGNGEHHGHSEHSGSTGHHGAIAQFMKSNGADILITCGIGPGAISDIKSSGIKVINGIAPRRPDEIIKDFITDKLEPDMSVRICRH